MLRISMVLLLLLSSQAAANHKQDYPGANGKPFQALQQQIDLLTLSVEQLSQLLEYNVEQLQQQIDASNDHNAAQDEMIAMLNIALEMIEARVAANEEEIEAWAELQSRYLSQKLNLLLANESEAYQQLYNTSPRQFADIYQYDQAMQALAVELEAQLALHLADSEPYLQFSRELSRLSQRATWLNGLYRSANTCPNGQYVTSLAADGTMRCSSALSNYQILTATSRLSRRTVCVSSTLGICTDNEYVHSGSVYCPSGSMAMGAGFNLNNLGENDLSIRRVDLGYQSAYFTTNLSESTNRVDVEVRCLKMQ
ncbi:hypothetical protein KUV89_17910 [Marinobacter hydrocarbonoclasticus]|nr:hypothetical protein [Marinobacter nauticus]